MTPTFEEACESVLTAPDDPHSLYTTLAPLYERTTAEADEAYDDQFRRLVRATPQSADAVLELGCGVGRLLPRLEARFSTVVGVDVRPELLRFADLRVRHADVVEADVTDPQFDLGRRFDAVVAFGHLTSRLATDTALAACVETARSHLTPSGVLVFDAVVDPAAVTEEAVGVFASSGYRLERAVDVVSAPEISGVELRVDYRVTDLVDGRQAVARERLPVRAFAVDDLKATLVAAGFEIVTVDDEEGDEGSIVVVARR